MGEGGTTFQIITLHVFNLGGGGILLHIQKQLLQKAFVKGNKKKNLEDLTMSKLTAILCTKLCVYWDLEKVR